jgi:hypothetical protein
MKAHRGRRGIAPFIPNLSTRWRWVVNFTPWPLYLLEGLLVPTEQEAGWTLELVTTFWSLEEFLLLLRFESWTVQPVA